MKPELPPGSTVAVTGMNELASGGQAREGFGVLAETLLAGTAALAVLAFVFGSALALVPLLMAAVAIPACFLAIYGLTEIGSRAIWGLPATGAITNWVPLIAFAFLYGLSMDYEVFILSRIREERDRTGSTSTGIIEGIGRTGRLVTGAALILFLAFAALSTGPETDLKVMATALGAGILLDATVVRALLVPALIAVLGRWNWWLPVWATRLLRVPASPPVSPSDASQVPAGAHRSQRE